MADPMLIGLQFFIRWGGEPFLGISLMRLVFKEGGKSLLFEYTWLKQ